MKDLNKILFWVILIALAGFFIGNLIVMLAPVIILVAIVIWAFYALRRWLTAQPVDEPVQIDILPTASSEAEDDGILVRGRVVEINSPIKRFDWNQQ